MMTDTDILFIASNHVSDDGWMNGAQILTFARALLSASKPAAPEGWKLVPVEPTEEMAKAYLNPSMASWKQRYRAMLAASPAAPAKSGEPGENP